MRLLLDRSIRRDWLGRPVYRLEVRLEAGAKELAVIDGHGMGSMEIFVAPAGLALEDEAAAAFERGRTLSGWTFTAQGKRIGTSLEGLRLLREATHEPCLTVDDLLEGVVLEAGDVAELSLLERGLTDGLAGLTDKLEAAGGYAKGSGVVIEPASAGGTPPAGWIGRRAR
jgi:hypothetical protein